MKTLKNGLNTTTPATVVKMKKSDGSMCTSEQENAEVFRVHFEKLYNNITPFDASAIDAIIQRPVNDTLDSAPTTDDVEKHVRLMKSGKSPGDNGISAEAYKALLANTETTGLILDVILDFWNSSL